MTGRDQLAAQSRKAAADALAKWIVKNVASVDDRHYLLSLVVAVRDA